MQDRLKIADLRARYTESQYGRLLEHALCLACLEGNAFPGLIEQYVPDAYANLVQNGWSLDTLPEKSEMDFDRDPENPENYE